MIASIQSYYLLFLFCHACQACLALHQVWDNSSVCSFLKLLRDKPSGQDSSPNTRVQSKLGLPDPLWTISLRIFFWKTILEFYGLWNFCMSEKRLFWFTSRKSPLLHSILNVLLRENTLLGNTSKYLWLKILKWLQMYFSWAWKKNNKKVCQKKVLVCSEDFHGLLQRH